MSFINSGPVEYFSFDVFNGQKIVQAVFTRIGGISPAPWAELNLGGTVGDEPQRVAVNRKRALNSMGLTEDSIFDVWQVHSANVVIADAPRPAHVPHQKADAILTNRPDVTLVMRFADCVPILLHDPKRNVVGLVHAGWLGTVKKVIVEAIREMSTRFNSDPGDILAGIGPSIGPDHYEIGQDVVDQVKTAFNSDAASLLKNYNGHIHFDLWKANELLLKQEGVRTIEISSLCTACDTIHWFSHRAEKGKTGRFGAMIALKTME